MEQPEKRIISTIKTKQFYVYSWFTEHSEDDPLQIRIYGVDKDNKTICAKVSNFTPYVYIELPESITWNDSNAQLIGDKIDYLLKHRKPIQKILYHKYKMYYALFEKQTRIKYPFLFCSFSNVADLKELCKILRYPLTILGLGKITLKIHEQDAEPVLQLTCCANIPTAGWIELKGIEENIDDMETIADKEYKVKWKNLKHLKDENSIGKPLIMGFDIEVYSSNPKVFPKADKPGDKVFCITACLQIENDAKKDNYLLCLGDPDQKIVGEDVTIIRFETETALLIGFKDLIKKLKPNIIVGYNIFMFDIPYLLERAKQNFCIDEFDKIGFHKYNSSSIKKIKWSSKAYKNQEFDCLEAEGILFMDLMPLIRRDYTTLRSYTLKYVSTYFLGNTKEDLSVSGIFKCYRLGMKGGLRGQKAMGIVCKYGMKDAVLVIDLLNHLKSWVGLCEMASVCNTQIFTLYTQGQQIKVYSQIYKYCMYNNFVVQKDGYVCKDTDRYAGAYVFEPVPGYYSDLCPFDFASLYPTTIIAYNLDYSSLVREGDNVSNDECHVLEWEDHMGCIHDPKVIRKNELTEIINEIKKEVTVYRKEKTKTKKKDEKEQFDFKIKSLLESIVPYGEERSKLVKGKPKDIMCQKRFFKFRKEPMGILPSILKNLLDARSNTRKEIKKYEERLKEEKDGKISEEMSNIINILEKRQLAYKISANSTYGITGVKRGYAPCYPVAMATTYLGRKNIEKVSVIIPRDFGGKLIYGDTDSNYIQFPHLTTPQDVWDHAVKVSIEVSKHFLKPIRLEFENKVYRDFFILTKKKYMYRVCNREGIMIEEIGKRGVLTARRDNCEFIRNLYTEIITRVFDKEDIKDTLYYVITEINKLCSGVIDPKKFFISKSVGSINSMCLEPIEEKKDDKKNQDDEIVAENSGVTKVKKKILKAKMGDYTVPLLSKNDTEKKEQMKKKNATTEKEFYLHCLPAHIQLAEKMKKRGQQVEVGTRLEYVISTQAPHGSKQYLQIESAEYFMLHRDIIKIDFFYYLDNLINSLDQLLDIVRDKTIVKKVIQNQYDYRYKIRGKVIRDIKKLSEPKLSFV